MENRQTFSDWSIWQIYKRLEMLDAGAAAENGEYDALVNEGVTRMFRPKRRTTRKDAGQLQITYS
jgi:hypothetical protein